jgi:hypothetical protein
VLQVGFVIVGLGVLAAANVLCAWLVTEDREPAYLDDVRRWELQTGALGVLALPLGLELVYLGCWWNTLT